jgi:hypothetical protein
MHYLIKCNARPCTAEPKIWQIDGHMLMLTIIKVKNLPVFHLQVQQVLISGKLTSKQSC